MPQNAHVGFNRGFLALYARLFQNLTVNNAELHGAAPIAGPIFSEHSVAITITILTF